jgi:hypothetical protein
MGALKESKTGRVVTLRALTTIGRGHDRHVRLEHDVASGEHAHVLWLGDGYYLRDKGSRNGTWVNRTRAASGLDVKLSLGDLLRFGGHQEKWECIDVSAPPDEPPGITALVKWPLREAKLCVVPPRSIIFVVGGKSHDLTLSDTEYAILRRLCTERIDNEGWLERGEDLGALSKGESNLATYLKRIVEKIDLLNIFEDASEFFEKTRGEVRVRFSEIEIK